VVEHRVERNVVFGMVSGLALLMDVHHPPTAAGIGILFIGGSGWDSGPGYEATSLKDKETQLRGWLPALLSSGYTVFTINHRAAPRFPYPAALDDTRRAARFIRYHAADYGIDPGRIGAIGGSSGGHLACLMALKAVAGLADSRVLRSGVSGAMVDDTSEVIQCLVLREAPIDLWNMATAGDAEGASYAISFIEGKLPEDRLEPSPAMASRYAEASPISYVDANAPPTLLIHGDADRTVPYVQSVAMEAAMARAGARVSLLTIPGGVHAPDFGAGTVAPEGPPVGWPDYLGRMTEWFDEHLAGKRS